MPWKGNDFQWGRDEKISDLTYDKYGHEHDEAVDDLCDLVNGTRKTYADLLRARLAENGEIGTLELIEMLDPYTESPDAPEFRRCALEGDEGTKQIRP